MTSTSPSSLTNQSSATSPPTPTPTVTTPAPDPNKQALKELRAWRADSLASISLDGRWVLQLASKYPGVTDKTQVAASGGSKFSAADIEAQFRDIESDMTAQGITVYQLLDSDFGTVHSERSGTIWTLLADPGGLADRDAATQACAALFPQLSGDALLNSCLPRRLTQP